MVKKSQIKFLFYFALVFITTFILLYLSGLVPEVLKPNEGDTFRTMWDKAQSKRINNQISNGQTVLTGEDPIKIVIDRIGVNALVSNPNTTNVATLDQYLLQGSVRYPGSGLLGVGNMFIFGHSTDIRSVNNQSYKTFNGLKDLQAGDTIKVYSTNKIYTYVVSSVTLVDKDKALVEFSSQKSRLTLSTCGTFSEKSERYVVEADYISSL
jgi:LPXTG-site transpeptidase (sortase) family protein